MNRVVFSIAIAICFLGGGSANCESFKFVGSGVDQGAVVSLQGTIPAASRLFEAPMTRTVDITLDASNQTVVYNSLVFDVHQKVHTSTQTGVVPGTLNVVTLTHTLTLNPFSASASNVGPLPLLVEGAHFRIDGSQGRLDAPLLLSGTHVIQGPTETVATPFSFGVPLSASDQFPSSILNTASFPNSVQLGGDRLLVASFGFGSTPPPLFSGTVDGLPTTFAIQSLDFSEDSPLTLAVPEPSTISLCSIIALGGIGVACWRRRRKSKRPSGTPA